MSIPQSFIQDLLARTDVVDVVGRYVELKKGGSNFMGLCPFHGEKSPSFTVSPVKQFYHCFGCGKNGNAIGFLMEHAGMGFVEAVTDLAKQAGLQVPSDDLSPHDQERASAARDKHAALIELLEHAAHSYSQHLRQAAPAVAYLKNRGVSGKIAKRFGLGYSPAGWRTLASTFAQYDNPLLEESGLVVVQTEDGKRYDRFRDRVMFPIRNVKGECIGFGGRTLPVPNASSTDPKGPKYLNSPETPVFHKGRELYGLYEARNAIRDHGYALVTEGYMDVVALAQLGFENTVATLGTACTSDHIHKLLRFTSAIVFSFDGDAAGRRAARKALDACLPHASDTRNIKFLFLPPEHDPDSYIREHGSQAFADMVNQAMPLSRFLIEASNDGCEPGTAEGRARMASQARPMWEALPDGVFKRQILTELATLSQLTTQDLSDLWTQAPPAPEPQRKPYNTPPSPPAGGSPYTAPPWSSPPPEMEQVPFTPQAYDSYNANESYQPHTSPGQHTSHYSPNKTWRKKGGAWPTRPQQPPLPASLGRADHVARILLAHMGLLEELSHDDHVVLSAQAAPHGPLFIWLEGQLHDHGCAPWPTLAERLQDHPSATLATRIMQAAHTPAPDDQEELRAELTDLLTRMHIKHLEDQCTQAIADHDLTLYKNLDAQCRALKAAIAPPSK